MAGIGGEREMDARALRSWLAEPRHDLIAAIAEGVRKHVAALRSGGIDFYGYALLPGEPYDIHSIVAATNSEADIKVPRNDEIYRYYRYAVDEWARWDRHDGFTIANSLLGQANARFAAMHSNSNDDCYMDDFQIAHADALLEAIVSGLEAAKSQKVFGDVEPFLAVWFSDSGHPIIPESVQRLNSADIASEFMAEFGDSFEE